MKQIYEAVQALELDIGFWRPSQVLLKKLRAETKCGGGAGGRTPQKTISLHHQLKLISLQHHIVGGDLKI